MVAGKEIWSIELQGALAPSVRWACSCVNVVSANMTGLVCLIIVLVHET